jgi:REP element-mobilizing transposase RayT
MPRNPRADRHGRWHHVMNRGVAQRTIFETDDHYRYFLSRMARAVRAGMIEVHAYALMPNHFHLLVRSKRASLGRAMHSIQMPHAKRFNRRIQRGGPLFRSRYFAKKVDSIAYRKIVVRYIDANPVNAAFAVLPSEYPYASSRHFVADQRPPWLETSWVDGFANDGHNCPRQTYFERFSPHVDVGFCDWVSRRLEDDKRAGDGFAYLVEAAPSRIRRWMENMAALADGPNAPHRLLPPEVLWSTIPDRTDPKSSMATGLLHDVCGLTHREIAPVLQGASDMNISRKVQTHRKLIRDNRSYAAIAARAVREAFDTLCDFEPLDHPYLVRT